MSYILDALRKAERERRVTPVPTLDAVHEGPAPARHQAWSWALAGALAVSAVAIYSLWAPGPPDPVPQALAPPSPVAGPASPAKTTPAGSPVPLSAARGDAGPGQAPGAPAGRTPVGPEPSGAPAHAARVPTPARAPDPPRATDDPRDGSTEGAETRTGTASRPRPPRPGDPGGNGTGERRPSGAPGAPAGAATAAAPPTVALAPGPPPEAGPGRVAPAGPDDALARLTLDVLVYSDLPTERLVFINGRKYVEGQAVNGDAVVEQITPEGAILRRADQRIVLRPKLNPYARPGSP